VTSSRCSMGVAPGSRMSAALTARYPTPSSRQARAQAALPRLASRLSPICGLPIARDLAREAAVVGRGVNYLQLFGPAGTPGFNNPIVRPNDGSWGVQPQFVSLVGARAAHRRPTLPTQILGPILRLGIDRDPRTSRPLMKNTARQSKVLSGFL
jgi:hypothetical protein